MGTRRENSAGALGRRQLTYALNYEQEKRVVFDLGT